MALPELVANSPVPGTPAALGTITADITTTGGTTITTSAVAPATLQAAGQFRICIDNELMIVTGGANTTTWTVTRQAENSSPATHVAGASIYHFLTADALKNMATQFGFPTATITVAASNAPAQVQTAAAYVCDGVADQVEINAAILALPSQGGLVLLSEGTYSITAPILFQEDYSGLLGMTRGTVIISMAASFSGAAMIQCNRDDLAGALKRPCANIDVGNFTVIGNQFGTQSTTDGIVFKAFASKLHDIDVYQVNGCGVRIRGVTSAERGLGAGNEWTTYETVLKQSRIHENGNGGVIFDAAATDAEMDSCTVFQNAGPGVLSGAVVSWITNCYIWQNFDQSVAGGSAAGNGIQLNSGAGRCNVVGNKIEQNRGGLRIVAGSENQIIGNVFASNSTSASTSSTSPTIPFGWIVAGSNNVRSDIEILGSGGAPSDVLIVGNIVDPQVYAVDASAYAIDIQSGTNILCRNNNLKAGLTGTIHNTLGGTNIFSCGQNLGYITEASGQATITSAVTSVAVTHGLAYAPLLQDIAVTLSNLPTNAIGELYVDTIGSTTFTIHCRNAPGAATAVIGWSAQTHRFTT